MKKYKYQYLIIFLYFSCIFSVQAKNKVLYQWLELGPDNSWLVRVITKNTRCPMIQITQHTVSQKTLMQVHSAKSKNFPVTVCQTALPPDVASASIDHHMIKLPVSDPKRIMIIGDTGCRMTKKAAPQICSNPQQWPFPVIAKNAALFKPDLIIHAGDYYYRESLGTPQGDNWATWDADFFSPAKPLLTVAPLVFARGNHEICNRGGKGWTKLLDPFSFKKCVNHSPLYDVRVNAATRLFVLDSANISDLIAPADEVDKVENYLSQISHSASPNNWIVTHKPFWFVFSESKLTQMYQAHLMNTLERAWLNIHPHNVNAIISGHIHQFQSLNFEKNRPAQIIMGASGTRLDNTLKRTNLKNMIIAGNKITQGLSLIQAGYMILEKSEESEKSENNWQAQFRDPHGKILARCHFDVKKFECIQAN